LVETNTSIDRQIKQQPKKNGSKTPNTPRLKSQKKKKSKHKKKAIWKVMEWG